MLVAQMNALPTIVVLAAGLGSRFVGAGHKLAQPFGQLTVLGQTVSNAISSGLPVMVVTTRPFLADVSTLVASQDVVLLDAVDAAPGNLGMAHSIAAGVAARPQAAGWLILPADMPMVKPATLKDVANALAHHPVAFAQHRGRRGHPVGFSAELYSELVQLAGDAGARRIVARYPSFGVEVSDPGVLIDIDTTADLIAAKRVALTADRTDG